MKWLVLILFMFSLKAFAQYPFEKYLAIKYVEVPFKIIHFKKDSSSVATARYKDYKVSIFVPALGDGTNLILYRNGKVIKRIKEEDIEVIIIQNPLYIADINGDGLIDFKIDLFNNGSGIAGSLEKKIYLFNQGKNYYKEISFMDFFSYTERDFDGDGNFEIISQSLVSYKTHNYWVFNLYNYKNKQFINIGGRFNYPIAIPYLYNETYKITNKIPTSILQQFSFPLPKMHNR
jgi:hypothetical protein